MSSCSVWRKRNALEIIGQAFSLNFVDARMLSFFISLDRHGESLFVILSKSLDGSSSLILPAAGALDRRYVLYIYIYIYACTQGDRVDLCGSLTHAQRICVHRGSPFCSRGTSPVNGIFSELSRSSAYADSELYTEGREIKCPTFLAFYRSSTVAG